MKICFVLAKCYSGEKMKENNMGETCGTKGADEKCIQAYGGEALRKQTPWKT
jgi:hypothetical protein